MTHYPLDSFVNCLRSIDVAAGAALGRGFVGNYLPEFLYAATRLVARNQLGFARADFRSDTAGDARGRAAIDFCYCAISVGASGCNAVGVYGECWRK